MAKVIKQEAKAEKEALASAVKELADLQKLQKYSVKVRSRESLSEVTLNIIIPSGGS